MLIRDIPLSPSLPPLSLSLVSSEIFFSISVSSKRYNIARLFVHRRTTDNFAKLRAGCLIAFVRHSGSANSRCIQSHVFAAAGYLLNPLLHRFVNSVRIPDKLHRRSRVRLNFHLHAFINRFRVAFFPLFFDNERILQWYYTHISNSSSSFFLFFLLTKLPSWCVQQTCIRSKALSLLPFS